jgi:5,10-methylenetetrahydromethanopterin reductase
MLTALRDLAPADAASGVPPEMLSLGVSGTPDDVIERCLRLVDMGATHVSFGPPLGPDRAASVRLLGERVLPALRRDH